MSNLIDNIMHLFNAVHGLMSIPFLGVSLWYYASAIGLIGVLLSFLGRSVTFSKWFKK